MARLGYRLMHCLLANRLFTYSKEKEYSFEKLSIFIDRQGN